MCYFTAITTISCSNQNFQAQTGQAPGALTNIVLNAPLALSNGNQRQDVSYITSPSVTLSPPSPNQDNILTGSFPLGTTYVFAYATVGQRSTSCFFTVTVTAPAGISTFIINIAYFWWWFVCCRKVYSSFMYWSIVDRRLMKVTTIIVYSHPERRNLCKNDKSLSERYNSRSWVIHKR